MTHYSHIVVHKTVARTKILKFNRDSEILRSGLFLSIFLSTKFLPNVIQAIAFSGAPMLGHISVTNELRDSSKPEISVAIPLFNEAKNIPPLIDRLHRSLGQATSSYEIVCVNDGSRDDSQSRLLEEAEKDPRVKVICLSRNFGHQIAITAGIEFCRGNAVIVMDGDLQDPPELIPQMIERRKEGFDVVYAVRKKRKGETWLKLLTAKLFYRIMRKLTNHDIPVDTGDYRLMSRRVVDVFLSMPERLRFIRGMVTWAGFRQIGIEFERDQRFSGDAKYTYTKLLRLALDGITSFSYVPLQLSSYLGFVSATLSFVVMFGALYAKLIGKPTIIEGWASMFVMALFLGGIQLLMIGCLGEYVGRIYEESKKRPLYIVQSMVNIDARAQDEANHSQSF